MAIAETTSTNPKEIFLTGWSLYQKGDLAGALEHYKVAMELAPAWFEPYYHTAVCHQWQRNYEQAIHFYLVAVSLKPGNPEIYYHAAKCLKDAGQLVKALPLYRLAMNYWPDSAEVKYSFGLLQFMLEDWSLGWDGYACRGAGSDRKNVDYKTQTGGLKLWKGEQPPPHSRLLVTGEQGMGDAIMSFRFASLLKDQFESVSFTVHQPLVELCRANAPEGVEVLPWLAVPVEESRYTHTIQLMDIPMAFRATPDNVPNKPYLAASETNNQALQVTLAELTDSQKFKVGVVWQGGKVSVANGRDVPFDQMLPLLQDPYLNERVQWISLQKGIKVDGLSNFMNALVTVDRFADTAAVVDKLDLIISVDTSVAHLAGAMGKPVWLLNRFESEWRWMRGKVTTPWYPTMRIFNERSPGDWKSTITEVQNELKSCS